MDVSYPAGRRSSISSSKRRTNQSRISRGWGDVRKRPPYSGWLLIIKNSEKLQLDQRRSVVNVVTISTVRPNESEIVHIAVHCDIDRSRISIVRAPLRLRGIR